MQSKTPWLNRAPSTAVPYQQLPAVAATATSRDHFSHSYLQRYESCALSAMLGDASQASLIGPGRPSWSQVASRAFHTAVTTIERAALAGVTIADDPATLWTALFDTEIQAQLTAVAGTPHADSSTWHAANRGKEGFDWWRLQGPNMIKLYVAYHNPTWRSHNQTLLLHDKTPVIDVDYDMTIRSLDEERGLHIQGIVPRAVLNVRTYSVTVLACLVESSVESTFELGEYGHALLMAMGIPAEPADRPILGQYWLARKGVYSRPVRVLQQHPLAELQYRYDQALRGTRGRVFAANVSSFCAGCDVRDYCPTQTH
jgi:hypothetical protein